MSAAVPTGVLQGCRLDGLPGDPSGPFAAVARSLQYQASRLGLGSSAGVPAARGQGLRLAFGTAAGTPLGLAVHGWPDGSHDGASEFLAQAASGLMAVHGRASGGSRALGLDYVSTVTAALALQGAMAAALGRLRGGPFRQVDVSLGGAALLCVGQYLAGATATEGAETLRPGDTPPREHPPFTSADGVVFEIETLDAQPWRRFWSGLDIDPAVAGRGWAGFQLRYAKAVSPLPAALHEALATRTYADIAARCRQAGVSCCPVRTLAQRAGDADARALWEAGPWAFGRLPAPAHLPTHLPAHLTTHPPAFPAGDLPLAGITVIESCRRIQGPLAGHLLALLGAQVIRLEPPGGDPLRGMPPMAGGVSARFDALNRLKSVRDVDLKTSTGRDQVLALAREADAFLQNWAPGKAAELGLDAADLADTNPRLLYAQASGWGRAAAVPDLPGTDFMAQAHAGVAGLIAHHARLADPDSGARGGSLFTVLDVLGGVAAAQGITAALLARELAPARLRVETSLLGAATLLTAGELAGQWLPETEPGGAQRPSLQLIAPTAGGMLAVECLDETTLRRLAEALGLSMPATPQAARSVLAAWTTRQALARLAAAGVPAVRLTENLADLPHQPRLCPALVEPDAVSAATGSYVQVASPWSLS